MLRWNALEEIPPDFGPSVVSLGNFDGVHRGHRAVLARALERSTALGVPSVVITFDPHPLEVLHPERAPLRLTSMDQRCDLLASVGVDAVLVMEFTRELAQMTPQEFVETVFVNALHARAVIVGEDVRFGVRNSGDLSTLRQLGIAYGFDVIALTDIGATRDADGRILRWSSTLTRDHLTSGDVAAAAQVLGRPHEVAGIVVHGDHRGRELGFPTANLGPDADGLVPADGVYAGWLLREGLPASASDRMLPAAISIGTNPTFDGAGRRVEAYVLDRTDLDLYGEHVTLGFVERLRPTLRFDSVDDLIAQMYDDVVLCRRALATVVPEHLPLDEAGESA